MKVWEHYQALLDDFDGKAPPGWEPVGYEMFLRAMAQEDPADGEWAE